MDNCKRFVDFIKRCSIDDFAFIISDFLKGLNEYKDDFIYEPELENGICGYVSLLKGEEKCMVIARQYNIIPIDINEIKDMENILRSKHLKNGLYLTTTTFSRECLDIKNDINISINTIDVDVLYRYISEECKFKFNFEIENIGTYQISKHNAPTLRQRNSKKILRVTFPDGKVFCDMSSTRTEIQTIEYIGVEKVAKLGMTLCHIPLISNTIDIKYKEWIEPIGDGYYFISQSNTEQKYFQLNAIKIKLGLNFKVEIGSDIKPLSNKNLKNRHHRERNYIIISFKDGTYFSSTNTKETFTNVIKYIGIDKLCRYDINVKGKPLFTRMKKFMNQQQVDDNLWLTIPNSTIDKCKILRIISVMIHEKFDITIV